MRLNIKDIIKATNCSELEAERIERKINEAFLLDWSQCTTADIERAVKVVENENNR